MSVSARQFLLYSHTSTSGSDTFYHFRVIITDDLERFILQQIGDEVIPLLVLDIPLMIPETIESGWTFNSFPTGGSWVAPEDMYFIYIKDEGFVPGIYPTAPGEDQVILPLTFAERPEVVYAGAGNPSDPGQSYPPGEDPSTWPPGDNGWYFPPYATWGFDKEVAGRQHIPDDYTDVILRRLWAWDGCAPYDEYHFQSHWGDESLLYYHTVQWNPDDWQVTCCNEGDGLGWLVVSEWVASINTISVWEFSANSSNPVRYYPYEVQPIPVSPLHPIYIFLPLMAQVFLSFGLNWKPLTATIQQILKLKASQMFGFAGEVYPFAGETKALVTTNYDTN